MVNLTVNSFSRIELLGARQLSSSKFEDFVYRLKYHSLCSLSDGKMLNYWSAKRNGMLFVN